MYYIFSKLIKYRKIYLVSMAKVPHLSETDTPRQIFFNFKSTPTTYTKFQHSVQFSRSVVSDSLRLHKLQHARLPYPSPTPRVHSDSRPLSPWCHPAISSSAVPFSSCPQSLPASESFPVSQLWMQSSKEEQEEIKKPSSVINAKK